MGEKVTSQWRNLANTMLSKWWWFTSPVDIMWALHILCYDVVRIHLWYSLPYPRTPVQSWAPAKFRLRKTSQNVRPIFLKTVKIMKNMEGMRNCHRPQKTKEIWGLTKYNVIHWIGSSILGTGKGHQWGTLVKSKKSL